ncbi:MAG: hypothetical protein JNJ77_16340 [Planctomycetia bacterium]|nr:hypothetical protein [Planctomycetia bacterium]
MLPFAMLFSFFLVHSDLDVGTYVKSSTKSRKATEAGKITRQVFNSEGKEYPYWLYIPEKPAKNAPLILFLHGSGEREGGAKGPHQVGIGSAIEMQKDFPFYVVMPQFSKKGTWKADGEDAKRAIAIMDAVIKQYDIDIKRLYLTGISMGGNGTWENAIAHADRWAAIAPVCGYVSKMGNFYPGLDVEKLKSIAKLPCWCFHGDKDGPVNVKHSRDALRILWSAGGHPNYTEYPGVDHECWDRAYGNPELYKWFLGHSKK